MFMELTMYINSRYLVRFDIFVYTSNGKIKSQRILLFVVFSPFMPFCFLLGGHSNNSNNNSMQRNGMESKQTKYEMISERGRCRRRTARATANACTHSVAAF